MLADAVEHLSRSVLKIVAESPEGLTKIEGSGFIASGEGHVLTALHVLENGRETFQNAHFSTVISHRRLALDVLAEDQANDLAVLRVQEDVKPLVPSLDDVAVRDGDAIAASGYRLKDSRFVTIHGIVASAFCLERVRPGQPATPCMLLNATSEHGMSGGPVYRVDNARVVGIFVGAEARPVWIGAEGAANGPPTSDPPFFYSSGFAFAIPIAAGLQLLAKVTDGAGPT